MLLESLVSSSHFHLLDFVSGIRFNKRKRNKLKPIKLKIVKIVTMVKKRPPDMVTNDHKLPKCNYIRCVLSLLLPKSALVKFSK